jgi:hypothetical protein
MARSGTPRLRSLPKRTPARAGYGNYGAAPRTVPRRAGAVQRRPDETTHARYPSI